MITERHLIVRLEAGDPVVVEFSIRTRRDEKAWPAGYDEAATKGGRERLIYSTTGSFM